MRTWAERCPGGCGLCLPISELGGISPIPCFTLQRASMRACGFAAAGGATADTSKTHLRSPKVVAQSEPLVPGSVTRRLRASCAGGAALTEALSLVARLHRWRLGATADVLGESAEGMQQGREFAPEFCATLVSRLVASTNPDTLTNSFRASLAKPSQYCNDYSRITLTTLSQIPHGPPNHCELRR